MTEPGQNRKIAALRSSKCVYFLYANKVNIMSENEIIELLITEAKKSLKTDDVPVGAVVVENGVILSKAHNTRERDCKITGHAEINAVEKACQKKGTWHLEECELYTSLEPCKMCLEVIKRAKIKRIKYISNQEKQVAEPKLELIKLKTVENSSSLLKEFFKNKRK